MLNPSIFQACSIEFPWFYHHLGMDQYLLIPFLGEWTSIYQLFWCSPGVQGFDTLPFFLFLHENHPTISNLFQPPGARVQNLTKPSLPKPPESSKTMPKPLRGTLGSAESWDSKTGFQSGIFLDFLQFHGDLIWLYWVSIGISKGFDDDIWGSMGINDWIYPVV